METPLSTRFSFGEFEVDTERRVLLRNGEMVALKPKAFDLLLALIEHRSGIVTKNELLDAVWENQFVEEKNLSVHIAALRKLLGERKDENRYIATIPGTGYKFVAEVRPTCGNELVIERERVEVITIREDVTDGKQPLQLAAKRSSWRFALYLVPLISLLALGGYGWRNWRNLTGKPDDERIVNSIAVLPFQFLTDEAKDGGIELGLTESLINRLSGLRNVSIRPISAVKKYAIGERDLAKVSDELQVDSVLEGYIQREGNRLRLTIRLLNTKSGLTIWNEQIDENFADIFAVQDKISTRVATSLQIALSEQEKRQLAKVYTENGEAYKKYLTGRYHWDKRTPQGFSESIRLYKQAIDLDPTFALAYAGLADSYLLIGLYGMEPTIDALPKARAAAEKALEIDKDLGEAEVDLAMVENLFQYDWKKAEDHFVRSIELRPSYSTGHQWFGLFLVMQGRTDEALTQLAKAGELDPLSPSVSNDLAFAYYLAGQNDKAFEQSQKTLKLEPDFPNAHNVLGMNFLVSKRNDEAITEFQKADQLSKGNFGAVELVWANGFAGNKDKAQQLLTALPDEKKSSPFDLAIIYTSLGDKQKAIEYLGQAYEKRDPQIVPIKVFPPFESLRQEQKFAELLRRMNL